MLVEFKVKNFRSFRSEQILSLAASPALKSHRSTHLSAQAKSHNPSILKTAVIYGPNASGKSNLLKALQFMRLTVVHSLSEGQTFDLIGLKSFQLDQESNRKPSEFELTFIIDNVRYQYGFALDKERVLEEWLLVYKTRKPQAWFSRKFNKETGKDDYKFSSSFNGKALWKTSTRSNELFLSKAVNLNSEVLRPIYLWIAQEIVTIEAGMQPVFDFSIEHAKTDEDRFDLVHFLKQADLGIHDISVRNVRQFRIGVRIEAGKSPDASQQEIERSLPLFIHKGDLGNAEFDLSDESLGTQRLFAFAQPIIEALKKGRVLVVDELDGSLHSLIVRNLIERFHANKIEGATAQLIFTTHDTNLLDQTLFRTDQIWFTRKDKCLATELYSLAEFNVRKNEAIEQRYLTGRYGAIPFVDNIEGE